MNISETRWRQIVNWSQVGAVVIVTALLLLTVLFLIVERSWVEPRFRKPEEAFRFGTIGTELAPLPVLMILPELFPEHFQPLGPAAGDWVEQFGFLRTEDPRARGLPVGFTVSNYRPQSGAPSPVEFVGFSCILCHSTEIRAEGSDKARLVVGPGNVSMNLFAWVDAFKISILDEERLNMSAIVETYETKTGKMLPAMDKLFINLWLKGIRKTIRDGLPRFDEPFGYAHTLTPEVVPTGPGRTQPFRTIVRRFLNLPGTNMSVYTKISTVYQQGLKKWAQVDGSVGDLDTRSSSAALAAGATVHNLAVPEIVHNVKSSTYYTIDLRGPSYDEVFPEAAAAIDFDSVSLGEQVYMEHCEACHGHPDSETETWIAGARQGEVVSHEEIGTDPERVVFRHNERIPDVVRGLFPENHPFSVPEGNLRTTGGYINNPLDSAFLRAPYLHNASILTLAELINLKPRRTVFYRGRNVYDAQNLGYTSPETPNNAVYFRFDTTIRGNSNKGHDYPWSYQGPGWDEEKLKHLLEYLKTL
jgi:mono/diheme cytochrome c family protein